jgi:hypothetical protein
MVSKTKFTKKGVPSIEQLFHAAAVIPILPSRGGGNFPCG